MYKVKLKPGQMPPQGNTGVLLSDGYLVIDGEVTNTVIFGVRLDTDPDFDDTYDIMSMTEYDVEEYSYLTEY